MRLRGTLLPAFGARAIKEVGGPHFAPFDATVPTGAFAWVLSGKKGHGRRLRFVCPCGCRSVLDLLVIQAGDPDLPASEGLRWIWDGDADHPTLSPSIRSGRCGWHGFLEAGVWRSA